MSNRPFPHARYLDALMDPDLSMHQQRKWLKKVSVLMGLEDNRVTITALMALCEQVAPSDKSTPPPI